MAVVIACDSCEVQTRNSEEFHSRGFVIKKHYCDKCVEVVDEYLERVDALHDDLANQWEARLLKIRKNYAETAKELPDVAASSLQ